MPRSQRAASENLIARSRDRSYSYGSTGNIRLNRPVTAGLNKNPYDGYWLAASDGRVFTFSPPGEDMSFFGSAP